MDNRNLKLIFLAVSILLVSTTISAFGVSAPYYENNPLKMTPGQETEVAFNLQNCPSMSATCDKSDIDVQATLEDGDEIAKITSGSKYNIKYGTSDTNIKLKVSIPSSTAIGTKYTIRLSIEPTSVEGSGAVKLGTKYNVEFPVIVGDESSVTHAETTSPQEKGKTMLTTIITVLAIVILIVVIILYRLLQKGKQI